MVFLNVRTLHIRREVVQGAIDRWVEEKLELKVRMQECGLYVLALSEVRLPDQGVTTYDDGFVLMAAGVGSQGATALLLSPAAASAWRAAGCQSCGHPSGRVVSCTLQLARKGGGPLSVSTGRPFALRRLTFLASGPLWLAFSMRPPGSHAFWVTSIVVLAARGLESNPILSSICMVMGLAIPRGSVSCSSASRTRCAS